MTDLQEGHQYSLSTENKSNKSVIFVKLTDSAVQSIESFFNSKDGSSSKPTIQFQDNSGIISLPLNGRPHNYRFTLSNIEGAGIQSSFQCLQHSDDNSLDSLGFMLKKIQIHGTEDSYAKTKCKISAADQEQKNLCTKELRQNVTRLGNKASVKRPGVMFIPEKTQLCVVKPQPQKINSKSKITSTATLIQQPIRQRVIQILAAKSYKKAELLLRLKREGISDKDKDLINDILVQVAKLKGNILTLENNMWSEVQEDWEFSSHDELQLIKKKKQQFLKSKDVNGVTGLSKPSVKQKDKSIFEKKTYMNGQSFLPAEKPDLASNGTMKPSKPPSTIAANKSSLQTSFIHQKHKKEETNGKLSTLLRNVTASQTSLVHQARSNGVMNRKLPINVPKISSLQASFVPQEHRIGDTNGKSEEMFMEIAINGNDIGEHVKTSSNLMSSNPVSMSKQTEHSKVSKIQVKQNNSSKSNINSNGYTRSLSALEKIKLYKQLLKDDPSSPPCKNIIRNGNINDSSSPEIVPIAELAPKFDFSEIQLKYTKVESLEQRSQYVKDFNDVYEEYLKLQTEMKEISEKFSTLFDHLNASTEGSPQYKKIKLEIGEEYKKTSKNSYITSRKKFEFLKAKLSHIRKLILEYDENL